MSKFEKLGGLGTVKWLVESYDLGPNREGNALVLAMVERVEELEAHQRIIVAECRDANEAAEQYGVQRDLAVQSLKPLRELAEMVLTKRPWDSVTYTTALEAKARRAMEKDG